MLHFPDINPVALQLGPLAIHWYGLMYLFGFVGAYVLLSYRIRMGHSTYSKEDLADILFYGALGIIIGGRLGYMLFYDMPQLLAHPLSLLAIWQGGMSFHGGFLGVVIALFFCSRKLKTSYLNLTDFVAPVVPIGLGAGRIGNFINGELWGRVTDVPWGVVFPNGGSMPRHPSELYEFFFEGVVLFLVLWCYSVRQKPPMAVSSVFLIAYGIFRFCIEFFREPDVQIGLLKFGFSEGQYLSLPMILVGCILLCISYKKVS
jgi:phosphatidylglycerol:prolipoprotein diacylglycerol transferase